MKMKDSLKKIYKDLSYIRSELAYKKKINKIYKHLGIKDSKTDKNILKQHIDYWSPLSNKVNTRWFEVYSNVSNYQDVKYIPENIYQNVVEAKLNDRELSFAYKDKNFYELFYDEKEIFPECILRNINGFYFDKTYQPIKINENNFLSYLNNFDKILVKPSIDSGGGKNVELFRREDGKFINDKGRVLSFEYLQKSYVKNFIIQNYILQDSFFAQFNPSSVNTVRIFTYRSVVTGEVIVLHNILRIGKKGSIVDNQAMGGISIKINDNSLLNDYAIDKYGNKYSEHNGIVFSQIKTKVPKLEDMRNLAKCLAFKNIYSRLMGFDFCLSKDGQIKLIEINNQFAEINFFQMNSSTLFGKYTDEIIQYCKN